MGRRHLSKFINYVVITIVMLTAIAEYSLAEDTDYAAQKVNDAICAVINLIQMVTAAIAAIVIIFAGLRWLMSGEDPAARNTAKTMIVGAFIGIVIILIAIPIVNIVVTGILTPVNCNPIPGQHRVEILAEESDTVSTDTGSQKSNKQKLPNLAIKDVVASIDPSTQDKVKKGVLLYIKVKNSGEVDASNVLVKFFRDEDIICTGFEPAIAKGVEKTLECVIGPKDLEAITASAAYGRKQDLKVVVDPNNEIEESDEGDNEWIIEDKYLDPSRMTVSKKDDCSGNKDKCGTGSLQCGDKLCSKGERCIQKSSILGLIKSCECEKDKTCCSEECGPGPCGDDMCGEAEKCVSEGGVCVCKVTIKKDGSSECCHGKCPDADGGCTGKCLGPAQGCRCEGTNIQCNDNYVDYIPTVGGYDYCYNKLCGAWCGPDHNKLCNIKESCIYIGDYNGQKQYDCAESVTCSALARAELEGN